jgi:hypothetical protein
VQLRAYALTAAVAPAALAAGAAPIADAKDESQPSQKPAKKAKKADMASPQPIQPGGSPDDANDMETSQSSQKGKKRKAKDSKAKEDEAADDQIEFGNLQKHFQKALDVEGAEDATMVPASPEQQPQGEDGFLNELLADMAQSPGSKKKEKQEDDKDDAAPILAPSAASAAHAAPKMPKKKTPDHGKDGEDQEDEEEQDENEPQEAKQNLTKETLVASFGGSDSVSGELHRVDDSMYVVQKGTKKCIPASTILFQTSVGGMCAPTGDQLMDLMEPFRHVMACCKFYFFVVFIVFQFLYIFHQVSV